MTRRPAAAEDPVAFVSYAREDSDWAARLVTELKVRGIRTWFDRENLLPGQDWDLEIEKAIERSRFFLALLSKHSISKQGVVQKEVKRAMAVLEKHPEGSTYIVPIRIDDCMPVQAGLTRLQWLDLFEDWEGGIRKLMRVLTEEGELNGPTELEENLRRHLGRFRHAILGPVQGLVSAARQLVFIAREAGADEDQLLLISSRIDQETEAIRLWRGNQAFYLSSPLRLYYRRQPLRPIVERVIQRSRSMLAERDNVLRLEWRAAPNLVCSCDEGAVDLILSNLMDNARKFSFFNRPIVLGVEKERAVLRFWVEDIGHGVTASTLQSLNDPSFAATPARVDQAIHGEGLGLKVARTLAVAHGGDLSCECWPLTEDGVTETTPHQVRFLVTLQCPDSTDDRAEANELPG